MVEHILSKNTEWPLTLLRIMAGFLFMPHGAQKLFGWFGGMGGSGASAAFAGLLWVAGVLEFFGGLAILLGLFARPVGPCRRWSFRSWGTHCLVRPEVTRR